MRILALLIVASVWAGIGACSSDSDVASSGSGSAAGGAGTGGQTGAGAAAGAGAGLGGGTNGGSDAGMDSGSGAGPEAGALDPSFGNTGKVVHGFGVSGDEAIAIAIQPDGKLVVGGITHSKTWFAGIGALARYNPDGALDPSFGTNGFALLPSLTQVTSLALQPDGKIVAGARDDPGDFTIVRLEANGTLDAGFGTAGVATASIGFVHAVAVQPDGKIIAAGDTGLPPKLFVARFNADGSADSGFGTNGAVLATSKSRAAAIGLETTGTSTTSIVLGGTAIDFSGNSSDYEVVRLSGSDGSFDTTFGGTGIVTTNVGWGDEGTALVVQPDGRIVLGGYTTDQFDPSSKPGWIIRYGADGTLDPTFGGGGKVQSIWALSAIVAAGTQLLDVGGSDDVFGASRLNADGSTDTTFGMNGVALTALGVSLAPGSVGGAALQADGKLVAVGGVFTSVQNPAFGYAATNEDFALIRLDTTGNLDPMLAGNGTLTTNVMGGDDELSGAAMQPDGKIVAVGYAFNGHDDDFLVARFDPDGTLDASFGTNGFLTLGGVFFAGDEEVARAVAVQPDGKLVVTGWTNSGSDDFATIRLNANGTVDTTWAPSFGSSGRSYSLALLPDGKTLVAGTSGSFVVERRDSDGSSDKSFGSFGQTLVTGGNGYALVLLDGGKFVMAGSPFAFAGFNADGSLDTSFGSSGLATFGLGSDAAYGLALQSTGALVGAGTITNGSLSDFALKRIKPDGTLDATFGVMGTVMTDLSSNDAIAAALAQPDDAIVVAGATALPDGFTIARYTANGTLDATFAAGGIASLSFGGKAAGANGIVRQPDGKLVGVGFTDDGAQHDATLVRVSP